MIDFTDMGEWVRGKRYLLVIVASYSGWPEAYPTSKEDAEAVIKALISHYIPHHGFPKVIRSDNGSHFKNKHLEIDTNLVQSTTPSPRETERINLNLNTKLAKAMATTGLNWVDALSLVLPSIRY